MVEMFNSRRRKKLWTIKLNLQVTETKEEKNNPGKCTLVNGWEKFEYI